MKAFLVASPHSHSGKTTISCALIKAFQKCGLNAAAFKSGPDFIDTSYLTYSSQKHAHNLDSWMLTADEVKRIFYRHSNQADVAIVESAMGLYDGFLPTDDIGSGASLAKLLNIPVLLIIRAEGVSRSFAAMALGFHNFDPNLNFAGVIATMTGGESHAKLLAQAMQSIPEMTFWGALPKNEQLAIKPRYLGLPIPNESNFYDENRLTEWLEESMDVDAFYESLPEISQPQMYKPLCRKNDKKVRIAVSRDEAFYFYYEENLIRLREAGAELCFFSPCKDTALPHDINGIYFCGGYPELYAELCESNISMRNSVYAFINTGGIVYAEGGGFIYLCDTLVDLNGKSWKMTGVLPNVITVHNKRQALGYREVTFNTDTVLGRSKTVIRGHEFRYSSSSFDCENAYHVSGSRGILHDSFGISRTNLLASFIHLHFGSNEEAARFFVQSCIKLSSG